MRRGDFVEVLVARDGSNAFAAARRGPAVHVQRRGDHRLHPVALSLQWRPLCSGADRAETGLFSRVSSRRRFVEGQMDRVKCIPHMKLRVHIFYIYYFTLH